jgi:hypothetical protein
MNLKQMAEDRAWSLMAMATAVAQRGAAAAWNEVRGSHPDELD